MQTDLWFEAIFIYWRIVCIAFGVLYAYTQYIYQSEQERG